MPESIRWLDWLRVLPQYTAPQHGLSRLMHRLSRSERPWLKQWLIDTLRKRYPIDLAEAAVSDPTRYPSLNAFFTRALKPGVRPLPRDERAWISPADGTVSQLGAIQAGKLIQAKGMYYTLNALLTPLCTDLTRFAHGHYATIYLAPHNYHRVHAPSNATLTEVIYVPGQLFSVNLLTADVVPNLFTRNERVIVRGVADGGEFALVMVGAMLVGSMTLKCYDLSEIARQRQLFKIPLEPAVTVARGDEIGHFNMGSTVILVHACPHHRWETTLASGAEIKMGQLLLRESAS